MKLMFPALAAALFLAACSDLTPEQRDVLFAEAVFLASELTDGEATLDDLSDDQRLVLGSACRLAPAFAPDVFEIVQPACDLLEEEQ